MKPTLVDDCFRPNQQRLKHREALALLQGAVVPLAQVAAVPLVQASGRVLAEDVSASAPVPAHTNSAVDGYAFRWNAQIQESGVVLPVEGRAAAGHPLAQPPKSASAVRIFTGAVIPPGFDAVAMQEDVQTSQVDGQIEIRLPPGLKAGANVRKAGEDVAAGTKLYATGDVLRPQDLAALASIGRAIVTCYGRVRVAVVSTGDEVIPPGSAPLASGQVYDANTAMVSALAEKTGCDVESLGIWADQLSVVTQNLLAAARSFDVIITTGGASQGEEDHVAKALAQIGSRHFWQLAVKPGRPMMFGQIRTGTRDTIVIGLPGNPVAVFVCFLMYVAPLLRAVGGARWPEPRRFMLPASFAFAGRKQGRREFWRGRLAQSTSGMAVAKFDRDGSGLISGLRWSDGLIDIPEDAGDVKKGDLVAFIPYSEFGIL